MLLALRFGERADRARAFALGLVIALVAGFRPSDAGVLLATGAVYAAFVLLRERAGAACVGLDGGRGGALGLVVGLLPWVLAHLVIFGTSLGAYVSKSTGIGLEWRLFADGGGCSWSSIRGRCCRRGRGIVEVLPWVIPGMAGLVWAIMPGARAAGGALGVRRGDDCAALGAVSGLS